MTSQWNCTLAFKCFTEKLHSMLHHRRFQKANKRIDKERHTIVLHFSRTCACEISIRFDMQIWFYWKLQALKKITNSSLTMRFANPAFRSVYMKLSVGEKGKQFKFFSLSPPTIGFLICFQFFPLCNFSFLFRTLV